MERHGFVQPAANRLDQEERMTLTGGIELLWPSRALTGVPAVCSASSVTSSSESGSKCSSVSWLLWRSASTSEAERRIARRIFGTDGAHDEHGACAVEEKMQQGERLLIAPLHVVQMEEERSRHSLQGVGDALEEALLLPRFSQRSGRWQIGSLC